VVLVRTGVSGNGKAPHAGSHQLNASLSRAASMARAPVRAFEKEVRRAISRQLDREWRQLLTVRAAEAAAGAVRAYASEADA
jgi:hypothetical protein